MRRLLLILALVLLPLPAAPTAAQGPTFSATFDGNPSSPQPWQPADWAADANGDVNAPGGMDAMAAHHGADCAPHPGTHQVSNLRDAVFLCNDHVMTAMSAGYGVVYLTPPALLDFSAGEAVLRFDASTFRTVGRDWIDLWVTPFPDQFALPLNEWLPAYQGAPRRAIQVKMEGESRFEANAFSPTRRDSTAGLPVASYAPYESVLTPSASVRTTFELRLSRTHVRFGLPAYNLWWIDAPLDPPLDWSEGVVQLGHHAYNPTKDCTGACANTWHWDNVVMSPARPLAIVPAAPRWAEARATAADTITLQRPTPANGYLRFAAIGANLEFSTDNGATWTRAIRQPSDKDGAEHFSSYLTPIKAGATAVKLRGTGDRYMPHWIVMNVNVLAADGTAPPPPATATPTQPPALTATPTRTATPTLVPQPTATGTPLPATATATATVMAATCEVLVRINGVEGWLAKPAEFCGR